MIRGKETRSIAANLSAAKVVSRTGAIAQPVTLQNVNRYSRAADRMSEQVPTLSIMSYRRPKGVNYNTSDVALNQGCQLSWENIPKEEARVIAVPRIFQDSISSCQICRELIMQRNHTNGHTFDTDYLHCLF